MVLHTVTEEVEFLDSSINLYPSPYFCNLNNSNYILSHFKHFCYNHGSMKKCKNLRNEVVLNFSLSFDKTSDWDEPDYESNFKFTWPINVKRILSVRWQENLKFKLWYWWIALGKHGSHITCRPQETFHFIMLCMYQIKKILLL